MSGDQFLITAWQRRVNDLVSDKATLQAHLLAARNAGDDKVAGDALEGLAECDDRLTRLQRQRQEYEQQIASQPAADPHGLSPDEQDAARASGLTGEEYARGKFQQEQAKRSGQAKGQQGAR